MKLSMNKKVIIVGGGLTGLSAAFYLEKLGSESVQTTVLEASSRAGGKIQTVKQDGFIIEKGPDSFLKRKQAALDLINDLDLTHELVSNQTGQAFILKSGKLHPIPEASVMGIPTQLAPILHSELISEDGKARVMEDLFLPPLNPENDLSVGTFFTLRLGREMVDHIISPLLSGIYAGNIDKLSLAATQPQFLNIDREYGSLIKGLNGKAPNRRGIGQFATLKSGLETLVDTLLTRIKGRVLVNHGVTKIEKTGDQYSVEVENGMTFEADYVILAIPAENSSRLLPDAEFLKKPDGEPNTSVATIAMAFNEGDISMSEEGTGFVVSRKEPVSITATTWTHLKWPHTSPEGKAVLRAYIGKAGDVGVVDQTDEALTNQALNELKKVMTINKNPQFSIVSRWYDSMPQYTVGHREWLDEVDSRLADNYPGIYVTGASYDGVGLPDCIRQGKEKAEKIVQNK